MNNRKIASLFLGAVVGYSVGGIVGMFFGGIGAFIAISISDYLKTKQTRYVPEHIKKAVLLRYFGMCSVCMEYTLLEFHHRRGFSEGGDNSERNIVPLCPKHHAMVTRLDNSSQKQ